MSLPFVEHFFDIQELEKVGLKLNETYYFIVQDIFLMNPKPST